MRNVGGRECAKYADLASERPVARIRSRRRGRAQSKLKAAAVDGIQLVLRATADAPDDHVFVPAAETVLIHPVPQLAHVERYRLIGSQGYRTRRRLRSGRSHRRMP